LTKAKVLANSIIDFVSVNLFNFQFKENFSEHRNERALTANSSTRENSNNQLCKKDPGKHSKEPVIAVSYGSAGYDRKVSWILQKFVPAGANGVYFAPSGTFKTFVTLDLCCSIAASMDWQELKLSHGQVFYIAAEGDLTIARRIKAWEITHAKKVGERLAVVSHAISPTDLSMKERLIEKINATSKRNGVKPTLVVFDTLAQCSAGLEENNSSEMGRYLAECNDISRRTGATVLNIHHTGKRGADFRGSSSIKGNVDFMLTSEPIRNRNSTRLSIIKQKDGEQKGLYLDFNLEKVSLGFDDQFGEDVTSLSVLDRAFIDEEDVGSDSKAVIRDESCVTIKSLLSQETVENGLSKKQLSKLFRAHVKEKYQDKCPSDSALLNRLNKALEYMIDTGEVLCKEDLYFSLHSLQL
jgi:putative DNA primase/helicase